MNENVERQFHVKIKFRMNHVLELRAKSVALHVYHSTQYLYLYLYSVLCRKSQKCVTLSHLIFAYIPIGNVLFDNTIVMTDLRTNFRMSLLNKHLFSVLIVKLFNRGYFRRK